MKKLAPGGNVYQAGTLSGNPLAMSAGLATLKLLKANPKSFITLDEKTSRLCLEMNKTFLKKGLEVCINRAGSMFTIFFQRGPVSDLKSAKQSDTKIFARFFHAMMKQKVWLAPSQYESAFLSFAHNNRDIEKTVEACTKSLKNI